MPPTVSPRFRPRKSFRFTFARGWAMPVAAFPRYESALTSALAAGSALIAAITCAAVLARLPAAFVPSVTRMSLPTTETASGAFAAPGSRSSTVTSLPPSWPHALEVRTTDPDCAAVAGELPMIGSRYTGATSACASASGWVRVTFGAGEAGFGVTTVAIVRRSWFAPASTEICVPARRPVVLASRIADAPAAVAPPWSDVTLAAPNTDAAFACASASGWVSVTFGAGEAGFGVTTVAIVRRSWFAPLSIEMTAPGTSPVVLATRIADAPAAAAAWSVVAFANERRLRLPLVAVRLVRQRDDLGDPRVLLRDLVEAGVDGIRRRVDGNEVRLVPRQVGQRDDGCLEPVGDEAVGGAERARDADLVRARRRP